MLVEGDLPFINPWWLGEENVWKAVGAFNWWWVMSEIQVFIEHKFICGLCAFTGFYPSVLLELSDGILKG